MNVGQSANLRDALLELARSIPPDSLFPAKSKEAATLIVSSPFAFLIACCLDRGTKAEIIWSIPYAMKSALGHLNPGKIESMALADIQNLLNSLEYRPRYINDAPYTIRDLTTIVKEECNSSAEKLWEGKSALEVKRTLMSIHGVGPGIANMTVLLIEKAFPYRFKDLDRKRMDIKPDVHTRRVLFCLGVASSESDLAAVDAARRLNPEFPGELDGPLWWIGRNWCHARAANCVGCPVNLVCAKKRED